MGTRIKYEEQENPSAGGWKIAAAALVGAAVVIGLGIYIAQDQMQRHRRDLFSPHPLRRLAALGYLKTHPSVDDLPLLRDYLSWEERPLLRKRASGILTSLEETLVGYEQVVDDVEDS
ncbi:MAG: hypothetical protein FI680_02245 [SAR202 cluster bacterium]|jgi:hypothetical protein|nr:hypothetical protein [SAR202 cluster bacterium]|tara:strand:- start:561 stop:914 length:354 start_codon:yes stop_codon:yes gene_type:complete